VERLHQQREVVRGVLLRMLLRKVRFTLYSPSIHPLSTLYLVWRSVGQMEDRSWPDQKGAEPRSPGACLPHQPTPRPDVPSLEGPLFSRGSSARLDSGWNSSPYPSLLSLRMARLEAGGQQEAGGEASRPERVASDDYW